MNTNLTEIVLLLDRSGSMGRVRDDVIGSLNSFVEDQKAEDGEANLTLVQFSSTVDTVLEGVPLNEVPVFTRLNYSPHGWTALLDAMIMTIDSVGERLANMAEEDRPGKVVFVILTDGDENASERYGGAEGVELSRNKVALQTDVYKWDFIFLAANQDAILAGKKLGVKDGYSYRYQDTQIGTQSVIQKTCNTISLLRKGATSDEVEASIRE